MFNQIKDFLNKNIFYFWIFLAITFILLMIFSPVKAHHSFAMFDNSIIAKRDGIVTELEWINPHVWLHIKDDETDEIWSFEAGSTGQLQQSNWTQNTVAVGERIEVGYHPLKDGSNGGQLRDIQKEDGTYRCQGNWCRDLLN